MKKPADEGPVCPGCGYAIFGLRDMRCPECGRTLDVRDFNIDGGAHRGESARYERAVAAGGAVGIIVVLALLAGLVLVIGAFARYRIVPIVFLIAFVGLLMMLGGLATQTGRSLWALFKDRHK